MTGPWRILVVDDESTIAEQIAELLKTSELDGIGALLQTVAESSFERALLALDNGKYDLLVLDVRDQSAPQTTLSGSQPNSGIRVFEVIRARRFIPIVFYTALPHEVESLENPPFVQVVSKVDGQPEAALRQAVEAAFSSGFPRIHRALEHHVDLVTRNLIVEFVEQHWSEFEGHEADLAHLLSRHLGISLERGADVLAAELGYPSGESSVDRVHSTRYYVVPPEGDSKTGDLLHGPDLAALPTDENAARCWYVVLTPTCDLVTGRVKAEHVVVAQCRPLEEFSEWKSWIAEYRKDPGRVSGGLTDRLKRLLTSRPQPGQEDRYHYLPAAWQVPDLLVDNQRVVHIDHAQLEDYERVASLDSPYAEALAHRFGRYLGRLGTPALDIDAALGRMGERAGSLRDDRDDAPDA